MDNAKNMASSIRGTAAAPVKKAPRSSLLRSCERCRRRKIRCDDYFPCAACTRLGLQCKIGDDRNGERSQSYLEERVRRLESLLDQRGNLNGSNTHSASSPSSSSVGLGSSQALRLQIPTSSAMSPAPEDSLTGPGRDFQDYQTGYASSFCSSPVDMANSPAADLSPWTNENFNFSDQASFFDYPPRRARSIPFTPDNNTYTNAGTDFFSMQQDTSFLVPDIPTIEVTSWESNSHGLNHGRMQDVDFSLPDLSVGSCSGPPSPSLTAVSFGYGNDEYRSEVDSTLSSRRSSMAYSEHSLNGFDSLIPGAPRTLNFTPSRPRSRSDVLPHSTRYLNGIPSMSLPETQHQKYYAASAQMSSQIIPGADEVGYFRTFFDRVHTYFPIFSSQSTPSLAAASNIASEQYTNLERFKILLILAIGSQYQNNIGGCHSTIADLYFHMASKLYPTSAWQQKPSLSVIQAHLLLAIYTILAAYSPLSNVNTQGSQTNVKPNLWMLNALITASAIDLNLYNRPDLDVKEHNPFIAVYVLDKVTGTLLGKPNLLRGLDIDLSGVRRTQGAIESNRMMADELASEDVGAGWRCVLEWYRINGRDLLI